MERRPEPITAAAEHRDGQVRRRQAHLAVGALLAVVLVGCTAAPSASPSAVAPPGSALPSLSTTVEPSAPAATAASEAVEAARSLLGAGAARVEMSVRRAKGANDPVETLISGRGLVEPANGRGHVWYYLVGLFATPGSPTPASPGSVAEVIWTSDDLYLRLSSRPEDEWAHRSRVEARNRGGLVGRLPDEVLGLVVLVARSTPAQALAIEDADIGGEAARRWLVQVPLEAAVAQGLPAGAPEVATLREAYGAEAIEVEAWLVDGALRRLQYELAREEAPYGGPDRTTVTYDWTSIASAAPIVVPPTPGASGG